ncbi:MAG: glycosyltransferase family 4 protein [Actinobacteria bacterium]|nr:glycosyltransferase family 4 protein [Actinomycetota bacterium]
MSSEKPSDERRGNPEVLIVNQYFPPDSSATAGVFGEIAGFLSRAGYSVTTLSGHPSYSPQEKIRWKPFSRRVTSLGIVERVGSFASSRNSNFGRATNYISYLVLASLRGALRRRADVVIVGSDPPMAIGAALIAAKGRPVIYTIQDLHPDLGLASGWIRDGFLSRAWQSLHTMAMRKATTVVCLGEAMAQRILDKGVDPRKVIVIPHGSPSKVGAPERAIVEELRQGAGFVVAHAGNIGWGGAWETIIDAAKMLNGEASFLFIGEGVKADQVVNSGQRVLPFRPPSEIGSVMHAGDLQLVTIRPGAEGLVVPSKMYSILAHGRPILAVAPPTSEVALLAQKGVGIVADPFDPHDIVDKIRWAKAHPEKLAEMGKRARILASEVKRDDQLKKLVSLVEGFAAN